MRVRTLVLVAVSLLAIAACERSGDKPAAPPTTEPAVTAEPTRADARPSFVNKVWAVAKSEQVAQGELRVFLSEGTLVMASPHGKPAFGAWRYDDGRLTIVEEGQDYPTDILELTASAFRIRMHSPGEPVEILFVPAKPSLSEPAVVAMQAAAPPAAEADPAIALLGTAWTLENLAGANVLDRAQATLEFPSDGRVSGSGSCNRFNGVVTLDGNSIKFGGIAATRMACPEPVMRQEDAYFAALRDAERFETDGQTLKIYAADRPEPLRFVAGPALAAGSTKGIERSAAGAGTTPVLAGIWTIVGHQIPGTSALTDDAARTHYGETLRLTARAAKSPGQDCPQPKYAARQVPAETYLAEAFKLPPGSLKPFTWRSQSQLLEVSCSGTRWAALGGTLLEVDANRAVTPWDGVFFEVVRDRDFRAVGQEPGWQLEIRKGADMRLTYDYGKGTAVTPAARAQVDSSTGTRTFHAVTEASDLRVEIVPVRCTDAMSGKAFPATVSVTLNGRGFRGCGEELATPYEG